MALVIRFNTPSSFVKNSRTLYVFFLMVIVLILQPFCLFAQQKSVLVFSKTAGFRHDAAISEGKIVLERLAKQRGIRLDTTENSAAFTKDNLAGYTAVVFLCTSGPVFNAEQKRAFQEYIEGGGNFLGVHSASTTEYEWPWYGNLVGAYFLNHPPGKVEADVYRVNRIHPATTPLPNPWRVRDEIYNFKWMAEDLNVVLLVDENTFVGGTHGSYHPLSWYHTNSGGRAFYTALGHDEQVFRDAHFISHLSGALSYILNED